MNLPNAFDRYGNYAILTDEEPEGLLKQLRAIQIPSRERFIYHDGKQHIAWVSLDRPQKESK